MQFWDDDITSNIRFFTDNLWFWLDDCTTLNFELGWNAILDNKIEAVDDQVKANEKIGCERLKDQYNE